MSDEYAPIRDWKEELAIYTGHDPEYRLKDNPNEGNGQRFVAEVWIKGVFAADGDGQTREVAELAAAKHAYNLAIGEASRVDAITAFKFNRLMLERSRQTEERVVLTLKGLASNRPWWFPIWITGIQPATYEQDHRQRTDAVVMTNDLGEFRLQIKSSEWYAAFFKVKYPDADIAVVVISPDDTSQEIAEKIVQKIQPLRRKRIMTKVAAERALRHA